MRFYSANQAAFSVIELMIVILLSSLLTIAVVDVFTGYRQQNLHFDKLMLKQENFGFINHILTQATEMTAYVGCASLFDGLKVVDHSHNLNAMITADNAILITKANADIPSFIKAHLLPQSDVLFVRYGSRQSASLLQSIPLEHQLVVSDELVFSKGDDILVTDCGHAELLHVNQVMALAKQKQQKLTVNHNLVFAYKLAQVSLVMNTAFYVANTNRTHGQAIYALYMQRYNKSRYELIPWLQSFRVHKQQRQLVIDYQLADQSFSIRSLLRQYRL